MNPNGHKRFPKKADGSMDTINDRPIEDTWRDMEKLVDSGKVKSIGVSNFSIANMKKILAICRIKPVVNQVESHAYLSQVC